ncbi:MAG: hypothetical protein VX963_12350 [Actinomycetota bacterium]|nr:hypothetical protein [Acidimicrobiaceae bacterium]MEC7917054.1 hypothetical protein [Actinomycetota bacterium]MEC9473354.1 hypothetical protein [Actinomycetota bacterium]MED5361616.1 hypothetical protein [Actinomycetota bacterium]MEE3256106.1 hypothetical protein [Actinomycetota bacterium]
MEEHRKDDQSANRRRTNWTLRKGVASSLTLLVVALLLLVVWIASSTRGAPQPITLPTGLLAVIPQEGAQAPKQTMVGVSLSPGWQPALTIDGVSIPDAQLSGGTRQLGEFFFTPGDDMVITQLRRGHICARVIAVPTIDVEVDNIDHQWCWTSF